MDVTTFPQTEEQTTQQDDDLKKYAGDTAPPPAPAEPEPAPSHSITSLLGSTSLFSIMKLDALAARSLLDPQGNVGDRTYKGFGDVKAYPTQLDVQKLRQNQSDPDMVKLFDSMYGAGSSNRYLNVPGVKDVQKLLENRDDPEMVQLFDRTYGDISKTIVPLYDPRTKSIDKMEAADHLNRILSHGKGFGEAVDESSLGEAGGSVVQGVEAAGTELTRSAASGIDAATGSHTADAVPSSADTRLLNHPLLDGIISGISQFSTGATLAGGAMGGLGGAGAVATAIRGMTAAGFTNAFSFNPNDPMLGDLAKHLGMGDNWYTKLDSIDTYKQEWEKRAARAGEGAALGAVFDLLGAAWKGVKAARAGDTATADAAKNAVADAVEKLTPQEAKQLDLPLQEPDHQLSLPLAKPDGLPQKNLLDIAKEKLGANIVDVRHDERGLEYLTPTKGWKRMSWDRFNAEPRQFVDRWGNAHQLDLDLGEPVEGPFVHGRDPGTQGELFSTPTVEPGSQVQPDSGQLELALHPAPEPEGAPRGYSHEEALSTPREQFIKDQIEKNPPLVREVKQDIEGVRGPRTEVPNTVRAVLDRIPDVQNFSLDGVRQAVSPMLHEFLGVTKKSPVELERVLTSEMHPQDVYKVQALTSIATKKAEDAAAEAGAKLEVFKKAKVTDAAEISALEKQVADAHSFLADLQKLDYPLGTFAGRLLQQRQIEARLTASRRVDIGKLRASGVSEERINQMLRTAMDQVDTTRLSELTHERMLAINQGDHGKVENLDKLIRTEMKAVEKRANKNASALSTLIVRDLATASINNMLSGFGTAIRNVAGILGHNPLFRANQLVGEMYEHGAAEGLNSYILQAKARRIALRTGFQSNVDLIGSMLKDAADKAFHNESTVKGMAGTTNRISASKYGLTGKPATVLNAVGHGSDLLTFPLRFTDEVASDVIGRHAVGTRAGFNFAESRLSQLDLVKAKLRDPNLSAAERKTFQQELDNLNSKNPTVLVDGQRVTLRQHVEEAVRKAYDGTGRLVDPNAIDEVNYILLRNRQTPTAFGQGIEKAINSTPYMRFLVPIFNAPMNGFKRGFEMMPGLRNRFVTDLYSELHSQDPYIRAMAHGKFYTGYAVLGTALLLADQGIITKGDDLQRAPRLSGQASSSPGPNMIKIAGTNWDISGLDPVSIPLVWAATFVDSLRKYNAAHEQADHIQDVKGEPIPVLEQRLQQLQDIAYSIMGATGAAILQNPALGSLKDVVDLLTSIGKASDDENAFGKQLETLERGQTSKTIPNAYKQMLGLFDNKRYDPSNVMDMLNVVAGATASAPMRYDMMGRPMVNKEPTRSLLGPFAAVQPPNKNDKAQYVIDTLHNWGEMTGKYFSFDTNPPDAVLKRYGVDLRAIDSVAGRKVVDQFAKNYREIAVRGRTIDEALYNVMTDAAQKHLPVGNKLQRGDVWTTLDTTVNEYKNLAWELTLRQELAKGNSPLRKQINSAYAMKSAAKDPAFDQAQLGLQSRTREMLRMFPQQ